MINNPWSTMSLGTKRRIDLETNFEIFWIKTSKNINGIFFKVPSAFFEFKNNFLFKEIDIIFNILENDTEIYLLLKNKNNLEIFNILCRDILGVTLNATPAKDKVDQIFLRLKKWENLLSKGSKYIFSKEAEKGLFGELTILKDFIIPKFGVEKGIVNWSGPEFDKHDFIIDDLLIEIKTYTSNKGKKIYISSPEQLHSSSLQNLYLVAVEIIQSEEGKTIQNLIDQIKSLIIEFPDLINIFELKLINYGYIKEICENELEKYRNISTEFYLIDDNFPRINLLNIPTGVLNLKYTVDLLSCQENKVKKFI